MRGSPLIRFFLLTLGLVVTAAGLARLTAARPVVAESTAVSPSPASVSAPVPYRLLISAEASEVLLDSGVSKASAIQGTLQFDPENPHVAVTVRWKTPPAAGEQRFAKLTLEPAGKTAITQVFDSAGDIDDFLELPLPAAP